MLNPIKSFFNYLQKNANSSNIFKASNDLSMTDEANSSPEGGSFEDPLTDPLAIDDDFNEAQSCVANAIEVPSEADSASIDNITFVDIEKLKCKIEDNDAISPPESDINGNNRSSLELQETVQSDKPQNGIEVIETQACSDKQSELEPEPEPELEPSKALELSTESEPLAELEPLTDLEPMAELDSSFVISANSSVPENQELQLQVGDSSFVISVISSEPENDEVTDTSVLLEEPSDGSDSGLGLGSDSLRSISAIEKNLATLTPSKSSLKRRSVDNLHDEQPKRPKRGINFGDVTVFYFTRCQGFGCVPTQGGSTLGMTAKHAYKKSFTLTEHAVEQRRLYRLKLAGNELNASSSSSDESKSEDDVSENSLSEGDNEAYGFLQPVTARQRRVLLKAAGVRKIDTAEKDECRQLRTSREVCGCTCRGYCDPDTCECSQAGIKCQVDRLKPHEFPCGCTRDGCANVNGRIEFNPARVKTHFIHTIMRLELEKRQEMPEDSTTSVIQSHSKWWSQMRIQQPQPSSQPSTSCNYTSYPYNNAMSVPAHQYPAKIPPISTLVTPTTVVGPESLDLHYAYRDEYINNTNTLSLNSESANSFSSPSSSDYYTNYNYLAVTSPPSSLFQNGYQPIHQQLPSPSPPVAYQPGFSSDCQYSNYTPTNGSSRFHPRADQAVDMNGFVNNYSTSMHNGNATGNSRMNYIPTAAELQQSQDILNPIDSFCTITPNVTSTRTTTNVDTVDSSTTTDANENLSEIIKKSIVETVSA